MNKLVQKHFCLHASSYLLRSLEVRGLDRKYGGLKQSDDALITLNIKAHEKPLRKFKTALPGGGSNGLTAGCSPGNSSGLNNEAEWRTWKDLDGHSTSLGQTYSQIWAFLSPLESSQCRNNPTLQLNMGSVLEMSVAGPGAKAALKLHFDWWLKSRCKTKIAFSSY